jgi:hypothetical protein
MSRRAIPTQVDIARALRAVKQAGVQCAVEIDPIAGTIRLIPDDQKPAAPRPARLAQVREIVL